MSGRIDTAHMVHYDIVYEPVDATELTELLDEDAEMTNSHGTHGMTYWLGVQDSDNQDRPMRDPMLRVDVDPETGAGALRWLPDNLIGVEEGYAPTVVVVSESADRDLVWLPADVGRVSYRTAREAAIRYVETGRRPENVTWVEA